MLRIDPDTAMLFVAVLVLFIFWQIISLLVKSVYEKLTGKKFVSIESYGNLKKELEDTQADLCATKAKMEETIKEYEKKFDDKLADCVKFPYCDKIERRARESNAELKTSIKEVKVLLLGIAVKLKVDTEDIKTLVGD